MACCTGRAPFRKVLGYEKMLDEHGKEMHGSWGNMIDAEDAFARMGADVMRWQYCSQPPNQNLLFGFGPAREIQRRLLAVAGDGTRGNSNEKRGTDGERGETTVAAPERPVASCWRATSPRIAAGCESAAKQKSVMPSAASGRPFVRSAMRKRRTPTPMPATM